MKTFLINFLLIIAIIGCLATAGIIAFHDNGRLLLRLVSGFFGVLGVMLSSYFLMPKKPNWMEKGNK